MKNKKTAQKNVQQENKKNTVEKSKVVLTSDFSLLDKMETALTNNASKVILFILFIALVFSYLAFDLKISTANDDALYIEAGAKYAKAFFAHDSYYLANAPLYPMLLGLIIKIFGVKLIVLKSFSILFFCLGIYLLYKAFFKRIPSVILFPALFLTAVNFPFLMYASLTYSECLYLAIIGLSFVILFKCFDVIFSQEAFSKQLIPAILGISFSVFLFVMTRNIALIAIVPVFLYLLYRKRIPEAVLSVMGTAVFYFIYKFLVQIIWKIDGSQYASQSGIIFNKDAYDPSKGKETIAGFITRFLENSQIYISQRFMYVLGFRQEISENDYSSFNKLLAIIGIAIIIYALYLMNKNKQYTLLFSTMFFSVLLGTTFVALQTSWGQTRFIMVYLPLILMSVFYIIYSFVYKNIGLQFLYIAFFFILLFSSIRLTFSSIADRFPVFVENMNGDPTYGYTPDWQNYIRMSQWSAINYPNETKHIAVRKAPMSFIFSEGKEFYPVYYAPKENTVNTADSLINVLRKDSVQYFMPAELRLDPNRYIENQFIGTVHRYMGFIQNKYPNAFIFIHQEGDVERVQLYKINWTYLDSVQSK